VLLLAYFEINKFSMLHLKRESLSFNLPLYVLLDFIGALRNTLIPDILLERNRRASWGLNLGRESQKSDTLKWMCYVNLALDLLFATVSRPGDSEVTFAVFESSCHLLLPV